MNVLPPLTGGALNHLLFGAVIPEDSVEVRAINAGVLNESAGKWEIAFSAGIKSVTIALVLPDSLVHTTDPAAKMPVGWNDGSYGGLCEVNSTGACSNNTGFNPDLARFGSGSYTYVLASGGNTKKVYVYLGGKVRALGPRVPAGNYTATVTLRFYGSTK